MNKTKKAKQFLLEEDCIFCHYGENGDSFMAPFPLGRSRVCGGYEPGSVCSDFVKKRDYREIYSYFIGLQE